MHAQTRRSSCFHQKLLISFNLHLFFALLVSFEMPCGTSSTIFLRYNSSYIFSSTGVTPGAFVPSRRGVIRRHGGIRPRRTRHDREGGVREKARTPPGPVASVLENRPTGRGGWAPPVNRIGRRGWSHREARAENVRLG